MSNPLIAPTVDSTKAYSGISLLETANDLSSAIESGDWASVAMGAVGTALDALSMAMDPFGAILAAGVSWLMEHVGPLKDALNGLTGNADQIKAQSETWANVAKELGSVASDLNSAVMSDLQSWSGDASDAYRQRAQDLGTLLQSAQKGCEGASSGVKTAGEVVAAVRTLVRDIISELVGHLISWALQVVFTLGIGLAWVVPQVISAVAKTASQITSIVTKLVKALKALIPLLKKAGTLFEDAAKALKNIKGGKVSTAGKGGDVGPMPKGPPKPAGSGGGTPKGGGDGAPPPAKSGGDDSTHSSSAGDPPPPPKSDPPPPPKGDDSTHASSAGGGDTPHTSSAGGGTPKSPGPASRNLEDASVHGFTDTPIGKKIKDAFNPVPASKVRPQAGPGGTTRPSLNADTPGANNFAAKKYPQLNDLNKQGFFKLRDNQNCTKCITAVDDMLGGNVHKAEVLRKGDEIGTYPDRNHPLRQKNPGSGQPDQLDSWDDVIQRADAYPNSKGFVIVHRDDGSSHVMNVIKDGDGVAFVDGQSGKLGKLDDNPRNLEYFRYDPPGRQAGGISLNGPAAPAPPAPAPVNPLPPAPHPVPPPPPAAPVPAGAGAADDVPQEYQDWLTWNQHLTNG
ncbi:toxin glutamine deamidase domain-containing protein [Amycolatopsis sp. NPDC051903]|uniref:toxin glutamine deamidase domain-containing protein n=1 Tax=Amycolatopsis sp. NPDC051903 TaxID=3363936 RepID=UPI0037B2907B